MKILHLNDSLNFGGAETLLMSYIPMLHNYEHLVVALTGPNRFHGNGYEYIQLDLHYRKAFWKIKKLLQQIVNEKKVDIVHSHSYWTNLISRFATPSGLKLFNHYHFADYDTMKKRRKVKAMILMDKTFGHKRLHRIAVSGYMGEVLKKNFPGKKVTVIPNFISCSRELPQRQAEKNNIFKIIAVGNCNTEKNYGTVIRAFSELKDLPVRLEIFGGGNRVGYFRDKVKEHNLDNIIFLGPVDGAGKRMSQYDLFLSASISETFGLVVLEAVCARLPLLISDIPAFREIAPMSASFFNPYNPQELAGQIRKIFNEKQAVDLKSYDQVLEKYSAESFVSQLEELYISE
ncbi:MAG: glycosyltransferase family 4 protein [Bacteroidetes bacterium]|nr:glycosyltransferase family 4 protein [Bacteroidota bacterium]MBS1633535.1 glycosyltransferase family 4 protein [Bacteroidota bacterium]